MNDIFDKRPSKYPSRNENKVNQMTYGYKSYRVQGAQMWNFLPNEIKETKTFDTFKMKIGDLSMPFCSCLTCLTLQMHTGSNSSLINKILQDLLTNKWRV